MIMIGSYQVLVKDACSGMNSIFALSRSASSTPTRSVENKLRQRSASRCNHPITIAANFIRVVTLVLIAYYGGVDLLEGTLHDLTGIGLFVVAVVLLFCLTDVWVFVARCRFWANSSSLAGPNRAHNFR